MLEDTKISTFPESPSHALLLHWRLPILASSNTSPGSRHLSPWRSPSATWQPVPVPVVITSAPCLALPAPAVRHDGLLPVDPDEVGDRLVEVPLLAVDCHWQLGSRAE